MRWSESILRTEREAPADALLTSHRLLIRGGFIHQAASGVYSLTPLLVRVLHHIARIVREEMDAVGGQEVLLPVVQPASLWEASGRYGTVDTTLARFADRTGQRMVLAMTHEEAATDLFRQAVRSYRALPQLLYQVQTKFRDEPRPRGGLVRLREFMMKDGYSFHADTESLDAFYPTVVDAYQRIFARLALRPRVVEADTGFMGGGASHEFMVLSEQGEDTLIICTRCHYAANREVAQSHMSDGVQDADEVRLLMGRRPIRVLTPSGTTVSIVKLARELGVSPEDVKVDAAGAGPSPIGEMGLLADEALPPSLTPPGARSADLREARAGDACVRCKSPLKAVQGIEAGNTFKLGVHYSEPMGATFTHRDGSARPFVMGCYGLGITRLLACIIEAHHDEKGIIWPVAVAPYPYHLVTVTRDPVAERLAEDVYRRLGANKTLFDDRPLQAGVKLADADLLGLPLRVLIGRRATDGLVELKRRGEEKTVLVRAEDVVQAHETEYGWTE